MSEKGKAVVLKKMTTTFSLVKGSLCRQVHKSLATHRPYMEITGSVSTPGHGVDRGVHLCTISCREYGEGGSIGFRNELFWCSKLEREITLFLGRIRSNDLPDAVFVAVEEVLGDLNLRQQRRKIEDYLRKNPQMIPEIIALICASGADLPK